MKREQQSKQPVDAQGTEVPSPEAMQNPRILKALKEWRATVDAMRDAVCLLEPNGRIRRCNRAMQQLLDRPFPEISGNSCWELVYGQSGPPEGCDLSSEGDNNGDGHPRGYLTTKAFKNHWYSVAIEPIYDDSGCLRGAVHVMVDVTDAIQAQESLRRDSDQLKTLHEIDAAVLEVRPPIDMTGEALKRLHTGMHIVSASVTLFDDLSREAEVFIVVDDGVIVPPGDRITVGADWVEALHQGHPCEVPDPRLVLPPDQWGKSFSEAGVGVTLAVPLLTHGRLIGALNLALPANHALSSLQRRTVDQAAVSLAVSLQNARLYQSVDDQRQMLHDLGTRMTNAEEKLRQRLAQELHDRVGQILTALGINLTHVRGLLQSESPNVFTRLDEALDQIAEISDSIRDVMSELRPAVLDDYGLVAALRWYAQQFGRRAVIEVAVVEVSPTPRLPQETETALFRIAQEALTNISKHASATHVRLSVHTTPDDILLQIKDNGVGFDPRTAPSRGSTGWGLMTMRERAESIDGTCMVDSQPGHGTTVCVKARRQGCPNSDAK
jgi:PAS domain S-box-containing protein